MTGLTDSTLWIANAPVPQDKSKDSKAHPLSVQNIGGVFVVLLCGLALAIMVAILEFCWNSRKVLTLSRNFLDFFQELFSILLYS